MDVLNLIRKYRCESESDYYSRTTSGEYTELAIKYHINYSRTINLFIDVFLKEEIEFQREHMWDIITLPPHGNAENFDKLLKGIGLPVWDFFHAVKNLLLMKHEKKNCIFIYGPVNSCKTIIAQCITNRFITCYATNHGSLGDFYFSPFLKKTIINLEELQVTCATADDYKSILGGAPLDLNRKHVVDRQRMYRTPIVITSNFDKFGRGMISGLDEEALQARCYRFHTLSSYQPNNHIVAADLSAWLYKMDSINI